jgi:hypothetical protein
MDDATLVFEVSMISNANPMLILIFNAIADRPHLGLRQFPHARQCEGSDVVGLAVVAGTHARKQA